MISRRRESIKMTSNIYDDMELVQLVMYRIQFKPHHIAHDFMKDIYVLSGTSPLFDEVAEGQCPPEYRWAVMSVDDIFIVGDVTLEKVEALRDGRDIGEIFGIPGRDTDE